MLNYHSDLGLDDVIIDPRYVHAGKYKGKMWNDMAIFELQDIIDHDDPRTNLYQKAEKMLLKRDALNTNIDVSFHAVNRFSSRFIGEYIGNRKLLKEKSKDYEGIVNYLSRIALEALSSSHSTPDSEGKITVDDGARRFVFVRLKTGIPRLITVIPND